MAEPRGTRERIIDATARALTESGYAQLTMADIAAESETSTALLHYHFDTKEDLLIAFLNDLLDRLAADLDAAVASEDPKTALAAILDMYVLDASEPERESVHRSIIELRAQAPHNERIRRRMKRADRLVREALTQIITDDAITFQGTDTAPDRLALAVLATMDGARSRQLALGESGYAATVRDVVIEQFAHRSDQPAGTR